MEQIDRVIALVREILGGDLLGTYLHGSAALDRLQHRSDLDILVVSARPMSPGEHRNLVTRLLPLSGPGDPTGRSRSVELTVVVHADVHPWRYPPRLELLYGDWLHRAFERGDASPWESPNPDLALVLSMVLAADRALIGPPPAELLDQPPPADVRRAMFYGVPGLLRSLESDTANVLLTLARIWVTLSTGEILPKDSAAERVLARLPEEHRPLLERARGVYLGTADDRWEDPVALRALAERILAMITIA